jgi:hypothetical protein
MPCGLVMAAQIQLKPFQASIFSIGKCSGSRPDEQTKCEECDEAADKPDEACNRGLYLYSSVVVMAVAEHIEWPERSIERLDINPVTRKERKGETCHRLANHIDQDVENDHKRPDKPGAIRASLTVRRFSPVGAISSRHIFVNQ